MIECECVPECGIVNDYQNVIEVTFAIAIQFKYWFYTRTMKYFKRKWKQLNPSMFVK